MRDRSLVCWLLLVMSSGCADSCACGGKKPNAAQKPSAPTVAPQIAQGAGQAGAAGAAVRPAPGRAAWQPTPDSDETRRLMAAQKTIEQDQKFEKLADIKDIERVLSDKVGPLRADGAATSTVRNDAASPLAVAARKYKAGSVQAHIKVTDTALLPGARRVVSSRLGLVGNGPTGSESGAFVRGYPAVLAHFDAQKVSRASALIGNRYLVQVMVQGAEHPDDALRFLEAINWSNLAPKQGKLPSAQPPAPAH